MKKGVIGVVLIGVVLAVVGAFVYLQNGDDGPAGAPAYVASEAEQLSELPGDGQSEEVPLVTVVAENLTIPWEVLFLPDGEMLVTQRPGQVQLLKQGITLSVPGIESTGEGGLLGAALHPDFATNNWLYLYETTEDGLGLKNRIVRYVLRDATLALDTVILDDIPGARYHDGGRIAFGPDGYLYATVGDALSSSEAANPDSLEGTILRLTGSGAPAPENPFGIHLWEQTPRLQAILLRC